VNQDWRIQRIADLSVALLSAMKTSKSIPRRAVEAEEDDAPFTTSPRKDRGQIDKSLVNNVLVAQMMQRQQAAMEAKQL
jgi:hypothetical protein